MSGMCVVQKLAYHQIINLANILLVIANCHELPVSN